MLSQVALRELLQQLYLEDYPGDVSTGDETMDSFFSRYQKGECEAVWAELLALQGQVRHEPHYSDALAVARETMRRAQHNIEVLISRLQLVGYTFGYAWIEPRALIEDRELHEAASDEEREEVERYSIRAWAQTKPPVLAPPRPDVQFRLAELEQAIGLLPLSLRAWYENVGAVNFVGTPPPRWGYTSFLLPPGAVSPQASPRVEVEESAIASVDGAVNWLRQPTYTLDPLYIEYLFAPDDVSAEAASHQPHKPIAKQIISIAPGRFFKPIAPDQYLKYHISGSGPYAVTLPNGAVDAPIEGEWHSTTFVGYLRACFRWAGLPGMENLIPHSDYRNAIESDLRYLTQGLLPI